MKQLLHKNKKENSMTKRDGTKALFILPLFSIFMASTMEASSSTNSPPNSATSTLLEAKSPKSAPFIASLSTPERMWLLVPFIITFSLGWGSLVTTRIAFQRESFGRGSIGKILGFTSGTMMVGNVVGYPLVGMVFDT